jgi:site-specific recombinase XerD
MSPLSQFLNELSTEHTRRAYATDLGRLRKFLESEADRSLEQATEEHLRTFLQDMEARDLSVSTQRRRMAAIRRFFDWLIDQNRRTSNPARARGLKIKRQNTDSDGLRFLSQEEVKELLAAIDTKTRTGKRNRAIVLTPIYAALRRSELASLNITDVRPLGRHWVIDSSTEARSPGGYIKIPDAVAQTLQDVIDLYDEENGPLWRSFSNRNYGERMSPDALYKVVRRLGNRTGLGNLDIDTLRRTGLRIAAQNGATLRQIKDHARATDASSLAKYVETESSTSRFQDSPGDYIDIPIDAGQNRPAKNEN